jgi:hypothetical protein
MIKNQDGKIAIKWVLNRIPPVRGIEIGKKRYGIISQRNVHLSWVEQSDLQPLLKHKEKTCNCNNGTKVNAFALASRLDVGIHEQGDRHYLNPDYTEIE